MIFNLFKKRTKASFLGDENFHEVIAAAPALVVFTASWCGACKMQKPLINDIADAHKDSGISIAFVDVDTATKITQEFGIRSMPTLCAFRNGKIIFQHSGVLGRADLEKIIAELKKIS